MGGVGSRGSAAPGIFALTTIAVAGQIISNVYPLLIGALASSGRATPGQLGRLATVEYLAMALTSLFAEKLLRRFRPRVLVIGAAVIEILGAAATTYSSGNQLLLARAVFAAACGIHIWVQYEFVALSAKPGWMVGVCTSAIAFTAILMSWLAGDYVGPQYGLTGLLTFFSLPSLVAIAFAFSLPARFAPAAAPAQSTDTGHGPLSSGSRWILASALAWSAWISILWVYGEPLGKAIGISDAASKAFVVASLTGSLAGAGLGALLSERLRSSRVLTIGLIVGLAHVVALLGGVGSTAYVIWFSVFGFLGYILIPFFVKALAAADTGRSSVPFFPAAQYAGASLGPLLASFVVGPGDYRGGLVMDLACIVFAIASLWIGLACARAADLVSVLRIRP